jgi:multidrug efflux pump subunit AcrB
VADFDVKTDPNTDLILTQSRETLATGQLPPAVNSYGVTIRKSPTAPLMLVSLFSPHGTHDAKFMANYAYINLNDPIARSYGVGQTQVFGAGKYAMRLWVKPDQLAKLGIIEEGLAPKDAARKAMEELSGPVIGIALVLSSVFVPTAFVPGITGRLYQQFAVTIAISVVLSAFNALTLSLALASLLLRPKTQSRGPLGTFFDWFNRIFGRATHGYVRLSGVLIRKSVLALAMLVASALSAFSLAAEYHPLSCPMKTRAMSTSTCSSRMRLRWSVRQRHRERLKRSSAARPASSTPRALLASVCSALCGPVTTPSISSL